MTLIEATLKRINKNEYDFSFSHEEMVGYFKEDRGSTEFKNFVRVMIENNSSKELIALINEDLLDKDRYKHFYLTYMNCFGKRKY